MPHAVRKFSTHQRNQKTYTTSCIGPKKQSAIPPCFLSVLAPFACVAPEPHITNTHTHTHQWLRQRGGLRKKKKKKKKEDIEEGNTHILFSPPLQEQQTKQNQNKAITKQQTQGTRKTIVWQESKTSKEHLLRCFTACGPLRSALVSSCSLYLCGCVRECA